MRHINKRSDYMEWAKTCSTAPFNLAASGLTNVAARDIPLLEPAMEITGPGGYGFKPLLERVSAHTKAPLKCITAATGASMANFLAMSIALNPRDEVVIEQPAYGLFADVAQYLSADVKWFDRRPEARFEVDPDAIADCVTSRTRLIVMTNLHNPSGALIPAQTLREIGALALKSGAVVLVDEVYLEMLFDPDAPAAFAIGQEFGDTNPFLITNSLTKAYGLSGLRCGWVLAPEKLTTRMWRLNDLFGVNAAHAAEQMSVKAFDRLDELKQRARQLLTANRALADEFFDAHPELECFRPPGGSVFFPKLPNGDPERFFALLRDKYETSVVPGKFFGMPRHFRIGIGGTTAMVKGAFERLHGALTEFVTA